MSAATATPQAMALAAHLPIWQQRQLAELTQQSGHAFLLEDSNTFQFLLALAQNWLCASPQRPADTPTLACGICTDCKLVQAHQHPDLLMLIPEAQALDVGWQQWSDEMLEATGHAARGRAKKSEATPKSKGKAGKGEKGPSQKIVVEAVRHALDSLATTCTRDHGRVVLIEAAQTLDTVAASTLLKSLEEPPANTRFVLACPDTTQLLATIRSRCQRVAAENSAPTHEEKIAWLMQQAPQKLSPSDAQSVLRATSGDAALAWELHRKMAAGSISWNDLPRLLLRPNPNNATAIPFLQASFPPPELLLVLQKICHDLLLLSQSSPPRFFEPRDFPQEISHLLNENPMRLFRRAHAWSRRLIAHHSQVTHTLGAALLHESLLVEARIVLN